MNRCDPRCPNAPEPLGVHECFLCEKQIFEGDYFYRLAHRIYCEECVEDAREEAEAVIYEPEREYIF